MSTEVGEMTFGRPVEGNQVIDIFHQVWCNDAVWKVCLLKFSTTFGAIDGYKVIISKLNPIAFLDFCLCLIK